MVSYSIQKSGMEVSGGHERVGDGKEITRSIDDTLM